MCVCVYIRSYVYNSYVICTYIYIYIGTFSLSKDVHIFHYVCYFTYYTQDVDREMLST